ncbi:sulfatase [Bacteroidota bacterium]
MKHRLLSITTLFLMAITACTQEKEQPNVLFIAIDDLNDWVGAFGGNPQMLTPHMDELASQSVVFQNANCPGPVCGPSRSALLSGYMPYTTGAYSNSNNILDSDIVQSHATLPEYFSKNGYVTISKGKIFHKHTTNNGVDHGHWAYDIWEQEKGGGGLQEDKLYSRNKSIINGKKVENNPNSSGGGTEFSWGPTEGGKEETKDYLTAQWFAEQLKKDHDKPFFMAVGISKPHLPWYVPEEYFDMYDLDSLKIPEYRLDDLDDIVNQDGKKMFSPSDDFLWVQQDEELFKRAVRAYMAASTYADDCVGVVLEALKKSKYADNTIIVLFGDHGWHLGEKLKFRKASLWKESTQLPLMIKLPDMESQQYCSRTVNLIDLYPTLIDLCGLPEKELDGESIVPLLENPEKEWHPTTTSRGPGAHSVISEDWHYINWGNGTEELYNLKNDKMEWNNLVRTESDEVREALGYLKKYFPENDAPMLPKVVKNKTLTDLDLTIKERRDLDKLN